MERSVAFELVSIESFRRKLDCVRVFVCIRSGTYGIPDCGTGPCDPDGAWLMALGVLVPDRVVGDQVGVESRGEIQLFKRNEGTVDRIVRVVVGLILLVTGIVGFCPIYHFKEAKTE